MAEYQVIVQAVANTTEVSNTFYLKDKNPGGSGFSCIDAISAVENSWVDTVREFQCVAVAYSWLRGWEYKPTPQNPHWRFFTNTHGTRTVEMVPPTCAANILLSVESEEPRSNGRLFFFGLSEEDLNLGQWTDAAYTAYLANIEAIFNTAAVGNSGSTYDWGRVRITGPTGVPRTYTYTPIVSATARRRPSTQRQRRVEKLALIP